MASHLIPGDTHYPVPSASPFSVPRLIVLLWLKVEKLGDVACVSGGWWLHRAGRSQFSDGCQDVEFPSRSSSTDLRLCAAFLAGLSASHAHSLYCPQRS